MLTLKQIREERQRTVERLAVKGVDAAPVIEKIIAEDDLSRSLQQRLDGCLAEQNALSKEIGKLFAAGRREEADAAKGRVTLLKEESKTLEEQLREAADRMNALIVTLPNVPTEIVPAGRSAEENEVVKITSLPEALPEGALPHWELARKYGIIDFELGVKLTGAGFPVYKGQGAALQRALISFFLDRNTKAGYTEVMPPLMVNEASGFGTGQLPDKEGQMYHVTQDNFYLIPTAEVPVTNIYRDVILDGAELPVRMTAYTPCFRREAGSYGKDVRGLNRLHQFDKVEIVRIERPENSYAALDEMVTHVESIVKELELPYRILRLCGGDISFTSALTYDFEVWSAAQKRWLEVSSVSNFETFQANRLKLRYRDADRKIQLAHTLNGSSLALPRIVAALLENKGFQRAFALRCLPREVSRNLWSQAEFDSVTARKLCELRERFYPDTVQFPPEQMAVVLTDLYARGATIVSSEKGYGIYFRREDTLYFVELMAEDDRSAEVLMEAAREKEVIVERAVITVGAAQNLFLGEGTRQDYGMIRFDAEPFDVEESYMRLMMES